MASISDLYNNLFNYGEAPAQTVSTDQNFDFLNSNFLENPNFSNDNYVDSLNFGTNNNNVGDVIPGSEQAGGFNFEGMGSLIGGLSGAAQAYMSYLNYGLGKDQLDFSKKAINRNLANEGGAANQELAHRRQARGYSGTGFQLDTTPVS